MNVLLLHRQDDLVDVPFSRWDLVVDLGRAPAGTYQRWKQRTGCEVLSLYDFAEEIQDLYKLRDLLKLGSGQLIDREGVDWWNVLCLHLIADLQRIMLVQRLAARLDSACQLWVSRTDRTATAIGEILATELHSVDRIPRAWCRRASSYYNFLVRFDPPQAAQVLEDKLRLQRFRFLLPKSSPLPKQSVVLLPTAYSNASRTAAEFAGQMPECQFLLAYTRTSGRLTSTLNNVIVAPLAPATSSLGKKEISELLDRWHGLRSHLTNQRQEFALANSIGVFDSVSQLLRAGIANRNAWRQLFDTCNISGCLCTDASNPATRICLDLAKARGIPAVACHHGALNFFLALQAPPADFFIAKSKVEHDYLCQTCGIAEERIVRASLPGGRSSRRDDFTDRPWLVFFSEPYDTFQWRTKEVYKELLPALWNLAQNLGLELVLKIHPFESERDHRRRLRQCLSKHAEKVRVISGPPGADLWQKARVALTVQSTTALECAALGIPIFLCSWLRDAYSGYVMQFAKFEIGHVLESIEQFQDVPFLLQRLEANPVVPETEKPINGEELASLFTGCQSMEVANAIRRV